MFVNVKPEEVGVSSSDVKRYIERLMRYDLTMHSILMMRHDKIFAEYYWSPYDKDTKHRMYSQTKSYVGVAVSQLAADGKINLDDKVVDYFQDKLPEDVHPYIKAMTIRHMLTMRTCFNRSGYLIHRPNDRVEHYFSLKPVCYPGTSFFYDSEGSFVLGALVERVTGKTLLEYLREKCLDEIGFSKDAKMYKCPGGHSWGDSALICTPRDMLAFARLIANKGEWNGKILLDRKAMEEATSKLVNSNGESVCLHNSNGYGHQIWQGYKKGFAFYGMHDELTIYDEETDIIFVCTAGNTYADGGKSLIIKSFYEQITDNVCEFLPDNPVAYDELCNVTSDLKLPVVKGEKTSPIADAINGIKYIAEENACTINEFSIKLYENGGEFIYKNSQGDKKIKFGIGYNEFQKFPQTGYPREVDTVSCEGNMYDCCASAAWTEEKQLSIKVQIIDEYIGWLHILVNFTDDLASLKMFKIAEDFLGEYEGYVIGRRIQK